MARRGCGAATTRQAAPLMWRGHEASVNGIALSRDGRVAGSGARRRHDVDRDGERQPISRPRPASKADLATVCRLIGG